MRRLVLVAVVALLAATVCQGALAVDPPRRVTGNLTLTATASAPSVAVGDAVTVSVALASTGDSDLAAPTLTTAYPPQVVELQLGLGVERRLPRPRSSALSPRARAASAPLTHSSIITPFRSLTFLPPPLLLLLRARGGGGARARARARARGRGGAGRARRGRGGGRRRARA